MSNWKDALNDYDLTTSEGLQAVKRLFVEQSRAQQIENLRSSDDPTEILDTFGAIREYNNFIEQSQRPQPELLEAPSREETDKYEPEFLIDNWMPANRLTLLTGPGGTGKSYLALQHIVGLALGVRDYQLTRLHKLPEVMEGTLPHEALRQTDTHAARKAPIKIVIASYEEDLNETWKRIASICDWLGWADYDALREKIQFVDLKMFGPIWGVSQDTHLGIRAKLLDIGQWLFDQCDAFEARLLMLDPSAGVYGGNENARESVREFCSYLNGWGQQTQCATLLIAHPPKSGNDYAGSTDWLGSCRALWTLRAVKREEGKSNNKKTKHGYRLTNVKQNYAAPQRAVYLRKVRGETDSEKPRWTPIWQKCSQVEAEAFYAEYHNTSEGDIDDDNEDDESDAIADLIANS